MLENRQIPDPVQTAILILRYAIENNTTLKASCVKHGKGESYVRDVKARKERYSTNPDYQLYLALYAEYTEAKFSEISKKIFNEVKEELIGDGEVSGSQNDLFPEEEIDEESTEERSWDERGETAFVKLKLANVEINDLEAALEYSKVDLNIWEVERHIFNTWTTSARLKDQDGFQKITNIQVKIWFRRKAKDSVTWADFVKELSNYSPNYLEHKAALINKYDTVTTKKYSLEVSIPDIHIGKLAWKEETGEDFDTKIIINRYNDSIDELLSKILHLKGSIEEIVFPIGNDMINIDNKNNMTTAGTPQTVDSRWQQMFWKAKELLVYNIDKLSTIAPVKVIVVSGNHDSQTMFYLGDTIKSWYRLSDHVTVNNEPTQRKYYTYGINLIGFTHGNEEKHQELGLIMATEKADLWSKSKFREVHLGHFHSRRVTKHTDVQEFQGFKVRVLPSLSGSDAWHNSKGYISVKSAVAFLYDKETGLVGEFSHNVL